MKICFPAETQQGMASRVYEHFGLAPSFVIVDTEAVSINREQKMVHITVDYDESKIT
jgi:predicted Fe-Mo cluster-binding NifX family protein